MPAGIVFWDRLEQVAVEQHTVRRWLEFRYVTGLLSFRDGLALSAILRRLRRAQDVLMVEDPPVAGTHSSGGPDDGESEAFQARPPVT